MNNKDLNIAVIGLGYVGLPLAVEFAKKREVIGFDNDTVRVNQLRSGFDITKEIPKHKVLNKNFYITDLIDELTSINCYIIAVPTPITTNKQPDLTYLTQATSLISGIIKKGDLVIYESTVFPGCTEEICVPILEKGSKLSYNKDFYCGYSPERINPGDKLREIKDIVKVTSGSNEATARLVDDLYNSIITAGTYLAPSIIVAEAAKVIENTQRDINIALVNELAIIFEKIGIDTNSVIETASTKWNFIPFLPGLVGGHCIGVDPYYLTHKAEKHGYSPEVILAGRRINDNMSSYVVSLLIKRLISEKIDLNGSKVLVLGVTFKENCPDLRNSKAFQVIDELHQYSCNVDFYDPHVSDYSLLNTKGTYLTALPNKGNYDAVLLCVPHKEFISMGAANIKKLCNEKHIFFDMKAAFGINDSNLRL